MMIERDTDYWRDLATRETAHAKAATAERDQAKKYATMLFAALAPQCKPMGDLIGILCQIDNATTVIPVLTAERDAARARVAELEAGLSKIADSDAAFNEPIAAESARTLLSGDQT